MAPEILKPFEHVYPLLGRICAIADRNRSTFGFLPQNAYLELATREQLWVAQTTSNRVAGYLLFGSSKSRIRIFQLYVDASERRSGIATLLVANLKRLACERGYQTISARVAADLEANAFWQKHGFHVLRQVPGGETTNRLINERIYEVAGSSLWQPMLSVDSELSFLSQRQPILSVANFAIDLNVLFDVTKDREHAALMREVLSNALRNEYRLCVTTEFAGELERHSVKDREDPVLSLAKSLPTLPAIPKHVLDALVPALRSLIFPHPNRSPKHRANDLSDLTHLASCIHHKVSGFITREAAILRAGKEISRKFGLEVLSPADLSRGDVARDDRVPTPLHADIEGKRIAVGILGEEDRQSAEAFLGRLGLSAPQIATILEPGTKQAPRTRLLFNVEGRPAAIAAWGPVIKQGRDAAVYLLVDEAVEFSQRAVDHVLEAASLSVVPQQLTRISLMTVKPQVATRATARRRGFAVLDASESAAGFVVSARYCYRGIVSDSNWSRFVEQVESLTGAELTRRCPKYSELLNTGLMFRHRKSSQQQLVSLFELETSLAPALVLGDGRPGVITPIREDYANDLISAATKQFTLFPKEAPLHLERAYFGKPGLERAFTRGAVVVFYISGQRNEAVGLARVTAAGRYSVHEALAVFSRQGVLSEGELQEVSRDGEVGVFTFDSYRNLGKSIPFADLRAHGIASAANLVTSQKIDYEQLLHLCVLGEVQ